MARLIPAAPGSGTRSKAERRLFERLRELSDEWVVLHSVGVAGHRTKRWAEIDFVLVGPVGVFCLEVKGGRVSRQEGVWRFTSGDGKTDVKPEGPFEQVGGAEAALRSYLQSRHLERSGSGRACLGWGVAFPDIQFDVDGLDVDQATVYDARDEALPIEQYVKRLARHWHERLHQIWGTKPALLTPGDVDAILDALRPDFDLRQGLHNHADSAMRELVRLTEEQCQLLEGAAEAERIVVYGNAGTGKTLVALEEARRLARSGDRVLIVCYNARLAAWLKELLQNDGRIDVSGFHPLCARIVKKAGRWQELPDADESYLMEVALPDLTVRCFESAGERERYDTLIIDEAQDLLRQEYLEVFDALLLGGLREGRWRAFLDPKQNAFGGIVGPNIRTLEGFGAFPYRLRRNCRNTESIATMTALLSSIELEDTLVADGPGVRELEYVDREDQRVQLTEVLNDLMAAGFPPSEITILSRYRRENSCVAERLPGLRASLSPAAEALRAGAIGFSTIATFKGLESNAIVLVDVDDLLSGEALRSVYIAASRARTMLVVLRSSDTAADRAALAERFGARLGAR